MKKEIWKPIMNFKDVIDSTYKISNFGNVKRIYDNIIIHKKIANKKHHPYYAVYLKKRNGKSEWVLVHQLVATFFVAIPEELKGCKDLVPDHLDNNGLNNYYLNLEWKTRGKNVSDAFKMGYINNSGENHKDVFITESDANLICKYLEMNFSYDKILDILEFPNSKKYRSLLVRIKNGLSWKEVSKKYRIPTDTKYTKSQMDTVEKLPLIIKLINDGLVNSQIFDIVYGSGYRKDQKMRIIQAIRKKEIYTDLLSDLK